jgi:asparagine synthase (glutamine-hydrolysing)
MLRFVAFHYDEQCESRTNAVQEVLGRLSGRSIHDWWLVFRSHGLRVWLAGQNVTQDGSGTGSGGFLLGRLFDTADERDGLPDGGGISPRLAAEICASEGRRLGSDHWGQYVAFLRDEVRDSICVVRDPTGTIPCFHFEYRGVRIFFSDVADLRPLGLFDFRLNPEYLRAGVLLPGIQKTITGLCGVHEVLPGEFWASVKHGSDAARSFIWNPYDHVGAAPIEDPDAAAAAVREVTERTIWTLAARFPRIVHHLGGLDSSIIYSCLARAPSRPHLSLLNFVTSSPRGDERFYAGQMAALYGRSLLEVPLDHRRIRFSQVAKASDQVSPLSFYDLLDVASDRNSLPQVRNADALFYGVGGDNVFMQSAGLFPVLDHVRRRGIGRGLMKVALNAMRDSRRSALQVAAALLRERFSPRPVFEQVYTQLFGGITGAGYHPSVLSRGPRIDLIHPLLVPPGKTEKGKVFQVLSSCFSPVEYYDQFGRGGQVERIHIFYSQPIVERCLRIPSWVLALNGIDRGLARKAFQDELPDSVLRRLTKSTPEEVYEGFIRDNRPQLRDYLLNGRLVELEICCRRELEVILSDVQTELKAGSNTIINLFSFESWARNWS